MAGWQSTLWPMIEGARGGDQAALRRFVSAYLPAVTSYCARRGMAADADDLAQEVMIRLFQDGVLLKAEPSKGRFRSLLMAVTKRVIGHHLERRNAQKRGAGKVQPLTPEDDVAQEPDPEFDFEWIGRLIRIALDRLAATHPNYHDALRMTLVENASHAQIAQALGRTESDVKNHVHRGKRKLVEILREQIREYSATPGQFEEEVLYLARYFSPLGEREGETTSSS